MIQSRIEQMKKKVATGKESFKTSIPDKSSLQFDNGRNLSNRLCNEAADSFYAGFHVGVSS